MKSLKINLDVASKLHDKAIKQGNVEYEFQKYSVFRNNEEILAYLKVDAYVNDEWDFNKSGRYEANEIVNSSSEQWVELI